MSGRSRWGRAARSKRPSRRAKQGLVRFIGVTGHEVTVAEMHLRSLARFDFDSVLLPYNYPIMQNPQYAANFEKVVGICQERNAAVQTIKGIQRRRLG